LLPHDLGPKGFYSGRHKSDLEGMTLHLASEGALPLWQEGQSNFEK
jgi:hypothetical protein